MKKNIIVLTILLFSSVTVLGQQNKKFSKKNKVVNKGKFFVYWGWNWSSYTDSDIRFKGKDYDFTLSDVKAQDRPTKFSVHNYFNPGNITIPQNNYRIGYFFKENYTVSIGVDHMKYVVNNDQNVTINGNINIGNAKYDGTYNNQNIQLTEDFLRFEHTDGLNYVNVEVKRFDNIDHWFGLDLKNLQINLTEGIGVGGLYPRTDTSLLGKERHDNFHLSGWGVSIGAGVNITFLKHFYIQSDYKVGYINMPDIKTSLSTADSASQSFYFFENNILIGGRFRIF
ncbi:hypothetical protein [uncultured Polaribacter sp.]|uniref:hypothetical protein n=1 Tax=uncultured Polaribacter sp. TaxID=174711 RepID=UPI002637136E|nr:hypothetical protein [uncultured Polaribacter sp.]